MAGLAGALFVPVVGIISPALLGVVPSIEMVIWVAVGGRATLVGAVLGAVVVNWAKTDLSERYPSGWLYLQGLLFVVVMAFAPEGLVGLRRTARRVAVDGSVGDRRPARAAEPSRGRGTGPWSAIVDRSRRAADVPALLQIEDLVVVFDGFKAIDDLDFCVDEGELRFLIGPNGAGKTTLIDVITGLTKPTERHGHASTAGSWSAGASTRSCGSASAARSRRRRSSTS